MLNSLNYIFENLIGPMSVAIITGVVVWFATSKMMQYSREREQFLERQRKVYFDLLDPQIKMFTAIQLENAKKQKEIDCIIKEMKSYEGRKRQFELNLIGSDDVVRANNKYWQHLYKTEQNQNKGIANEDSFETIRLFGDILVEVRKSLGNNNTKLSSTEMLEFLIKDTSILRK